jgi:hypothetical protein
MKFKKVLKYLFFIVMFCIMGYEIISNMLIDNTSAFWGWSVSCSFFMSFLFFNGSNTSNDIVNIVGKRKYRKNEYCKALKCKFLVRENSIDLSTCRSVGACCPHTAKEFHKWLIINNFIIVKK